MSQRAPGWGSYHSSPDSGSSGMLRKSRVGKGQSDPLSCQDCGESDELVQQLPCLRVLCNGCATGHVREGKCSQC